MIQVNLLVSYATRADYEAGIPFGGTIEVSTFIIRGRNGEFRRDGTITVFDLELDELPPFSDLFGQESVCNDDEDYFYTASSLVGYDESLDKLFKLLGEDHQAWLDKGKAFQAMY